ncbi:uncharacterized protein G2W53_040674 [Senna tora]|uniref:Uncharacterized protein n=1 Tax=Senna tora TaxID=362788 RepID=A0A834SDN5_9FABA|nr:uncharacterized protein G2W53_040674 [Senna tora]
MMNNLAESIKAVFKGVRELPIIGLVKATYYRLNTYFIKHSRMYEAQLRADPLYSAKVYDHLNKVADVVSGCRVVRFDQAETSFEEGSDDSSLKVLPGGTGEYVEGPHENWEKLPPKSPPNENCHQRESPRKASVGEPSMESDLMPISETMSGNLQFLLSRVGRHWFTYGYGITSHGWLPNICLTRTFTLMTTVGEVE